MLSHAPFSAIITPVVKQPVEDQTRMARRGLRCLLIAG